VNRLLNLKVSRQAMPTSPKRQGQSAEPQPFHKKRLLPFAVPQFAKGEAGTAVRDGDVRLPGEGREIAAALLANRVGPGLLAVAAPGGCATSSTALKRAPVQGASAKIFE
jgi:hypothetical protein